MNTTIGQTIFYLDRNSHDTSDANVSIAEMIISEIDNEIMAVGKVGYFTIKFRASEIKDINKRKPTVFKTREEAVTQHTKERQAAINWVLNMTKDEVMRELFSVWDNPDNEDDNEVIHAMKQKIQKEFGVNL